MHLGYSTSTYKERTYKSYTIAESHRDGKSVRKRVIWRLGKLTDQQAEQIKLILEVVQTKDQVVTRLKDIVVRESRAYLDIAVVNALWDQWQLDGAFNYDVTDSALPTHTMAKILTINRCTDPCSHYSVPMWAEKTALREVLGMDLSGLNDDKIYYELDKIHNNKASIENYLFKRIYSDNPDAFDFVNYDLSTTYFIGYKCALSAFGKGKIECHGRPQTHTALKQRNRFHEYRGTGQKSNLLIGKPGEVHLRSGLPVEGATVRLSFSPSFAIQRGGLS